MKDDRRTANMDRNILKLIFDRVSTLSRIGLPFFD
jgi:hypothetical protein